jgi:hypothetical protein
LENPLNEQIATFLKRIPQSNQPPATFSELSTPDGVEVMRGVALALQMFGIVQVEGNTLRASSQTAKYTLNSLAETLLAGQPVVSDWHTRGLHEHPLSNGASFLALLEAQRLQHNPNAAPSRVERVAQVIIKRTNPTNGKPELLFQFDRNAHRYQFIGGRYSPRDHDDMRQTIIREITEELPKNNLIVQQDYQLTLLVENLTTAPVISPTFGALTQYSFTLFHMHDLKKSLVLDYSDRWLSIDDVLTDTVRDDEGQPFPFSNHGIYPLMNEQVGGFVHLVDSVRTTS